MYSELCVFVLVNEGTSHKYHKNTSKLAELAEEFKKSKEVPQTAPRLVLHQACYMT